MSWTPWQIWPTSSTSLVFPGERQPYFVPYGAFQVGLLSEILGGAAHGTAYLSLDKTGWWDLVGLDLDIHRSGYQKLSRMFG